MARATTVVADDTDMWAVTVASATVGAVVVVSLERWSVGRRPLSIGSVVVISRVAKAGTAI